MLFAATPFAFCVFKYVPMIHYYTHFTPKTVLQIMMGLFITFIYTYKFFFIIHNLLCKRVVVNSMCLCLYIGLVLLNKVVFITYKL